jgi:hypothetical protein
VFAAETSSGLVAGAEGAATDCAVCAVNQDAAWGGTTGPAPAEWSALAEEQGGLSPSLIEGHIGGAFEEMEGAAGLAARMEELGPGARGIVEGPEPSHPEPKQVGQLPLVGDRPMTKGDVVRFLTQRTPPPSGSEWRVTDRGDGFWGATMWDVAGTPRPYVGAWTVVCPDTRVIRFSGSPQIHDPVHVIATLREWYEGGRTFTDDEIRTEVGRRTVTD